jgi:hypothetical protein
MNISKKHHYIPRFYLKGFVDKEDQFFIFDKETKKMWKSNPDNSFTENHLNTGVLIDQRTGEIFKSDLPEQMLSHYDSRSASALEEIRNSNPIDNILTDERLYAIRFFIISTFWRTPANDKLREEIISKFSFSDLGFGFFDKNGFRNSEVEKMIADTDLWKKLYPILLPITSFTNKFNKLNKEKWAIYYRQQSFHLTSDNPIIFKEYTDFSSLHENLIFSLSSKHLVISTQGIKPRVLEPVFSIKTDILLFHNAYRYVACSDKNYLKFISDEAYKIIDKPQWIDKLKQDVFCYLE